MEIDFLPMALGLGLLALGFSGFMMAGSSFWPQQAEQYKKQIPTIITGIVLVIIAGAVIDFLR